MNILTLLRLSCAVLCVLPWVANGITLGDGERTGVTLSQGAVNQLRVSADRIETIRGIPPEVLVTLDPVLGDAYLTVNSEKPFTAFITTEKKRRVVLDCLPLLDVPPKVIVIDAPLPPALIAPPPGAEKSDVVAFMQELRRAIKALPATQKTFVHHDSPKRRTATRVMLVEKQQGRLVGRGYWVRSLKVLQKQANENDNVVARVVSPVSRGLHHGFYVVEVSYV